MPNENTLREDDTGSGEKRPDATGKAKEINKVRRGEHPERERMSSRNKVREHGLVNEDQIPPKGN